MLANFTSLIHKNVTNIGDKYYNTGNILKPETNPVVNTQTDGHVMYWTRDILA